MYSFFTSLNAARRATAAANSAFYTSAMALSIPSPQELIIAKPPLISVLSNRGSAGAVQQVPINAGTSNWGANAAIVDAVTCDTFTTNSAGNLQVSMTL